jgi:GNAT superfamily N-acetyltransferase
VKGLLATMRAFYRVEAATSPDARVVEHDGVTAVLTPSAPTQSILNCVLWDGLAELEAALEPVAAAYAEAGVTHWMVWTTPGDDAAVALLRAAGHVLEYEPLALRVELADELRAPRPGGPDFELDRDPDPSEITTLNEVANGEPPGAFGSAFGGLRDPRFRRWVARLDGRPAACLVTFDEGDNTMVQWVATDPLQQRRRLAGRLLHAALADARERGMRSATLESSSEGERLYGGLGFRSLGRLGMWLREGSPAGLP